MCFRLCLSRPFLAAPDEYDGYGGEAAAEQRSAQMIHG